MDLPRKADAELDAVWDELVAGPDALLLARGALARAKAWAIIAAEESEVEPEEGGAEALARAREYADLTTSKAQDSGAMHILRQVDLLYELLAEMGGPLPPSVVFPMGLGDHVRKVGEIVRLVGVRVAEGWK
jgi:hypothetical protein